LEELALSGDFKLIIFRLFPQQIQSNYWVRYKERNSESMHTTKKKGANEARDSNKPLKSSVENLNSPVNNKNEKKVAKKIYFQDTSPEVLKFISVASPNFVRSVRNQRKRPFVIEKLTV
jgi:hypothetical protein